MLSDNRGSGRRRSTIRTKSQWFAEIAPWQSRASNLVQANRIDLLELVVVDLQEPNQEPDIDDRRLGRETVNAGDVTTGIEQLVARHR
ncbi:hypothetical protein JQ599_18805 [Bradyrhizobium diazoefficiens]|nr:hypothetical protein [Bradyrhizobium diazoefficiens]MBR0701973.1 hypothetical protein [Bradyrhizobium diazoefficiens]MBR0770396.1 hypothetical protein [Bradyrhizobium diazoefficiens]